MDFNPIDVVLICVFVSPIIMGIIKGFDPEDVKYEFWHIEKDIMFILSIFLGILIVSKTQLISKLLQKLSESFSLLLNFNFLFNKFIYFILFFIFIYIIYRILLIITRIINNLTIEPVLLFIFEITKRGGKFLLSIFGGIFSAPTAIINVIIIAFIIKGISLMPIPGNINYYINNSSYYQKINNKLIEPISKSNFVKDFPIVLRDSFKVKVVHVNEENQDTPKPKRKSREVVYFNGVTLEHGIKSSEAINQEANKITLAKITSREKAFAIYNWIGKNITYNHNKANEIMRGEYKTDSGARAAFNTSEGICFDYSCLYVAMARHIGLKVRLVTGEGFNGTEWVPHAWNEVYVNDRWINVDTTFYNAGNYFDSKTFNKDHKNPNIVGEW